MKKQTELKAEKSEEREETVEELFGQLDGILEKLTEGSLSLEDSFKCYESGMRLVKTCNEKIDKVEKQIVVLNEGNA